MEWERTLEWIGWIGPPAVVIVATWYVLRPRNERTERPSAEDHAVKSASGGSQSASDPATVSREESQVKKKQLGTIRYLEAALVVWLLLRPIYKVLAIVLLVLFTWYMVDGRYSWQGEYRIDRLTGKRTHCSTNGCG